MDNMDSLAPNDQPVVDPNRRPNDSFHAESSACELFQLLMGAYYYI